MLKRFKSVPEMFEKPKVGATEQLCHPTIELAKQLINCPSITPKEAGAQLILIERLKKLGFSIEEYHKNDVSNFLAIKGTGGPFLCFAGHTDVVPPGNNAKWQTDPFVATEKNGFIFGRGASDMKGSLASMIVSIEKFISYNPNFNGTLGLIITSDEEGEAKFGTNEIVKQLIKQGRSIDYCILGEPTSEKSLGDSIRIGRRGSINCKITVQGKQGHVGYPEHLKNPIHQTSKLVHKLSNKRWDLPSRYFPSTSFQLVKLHSESGALNVTPASLELIFNLRYSPRNTYEKIKKYVEKKVQKYELDAKIEWEHEANPYITKRGFLRKAVQKAIFNKFGYMPKLTTAGGISDGRFIKEVCKQVIELGPSNKTIHQANECVSTSQLSELTGLYLNLLNQILKK